MRSRYQIDTYQATYFVIDSFQQFFDATAPDFTTLYARVRETIATAGEIEAGVVLPGERSFRPDRFDKPALHFLPRRLVVGHVHVRHPAQMPVVGAGHRGGGGREDDVVAVAVEAGQATRTTLGLARCQCLQPA